MFKAVEVKLVLLLYQLTSGVAVSLNVCIRYKLVLAKFLIIPKNAVMGKSERSIAVNTGNVIKLRKSKIVTGKKDPVTNFMNIM